MSQAQQEYLRRQLVASESTAAQLRRELEAAESALQAAEASASERESTHARQVAVLTREAAAAEAELEALRQPPRHTDLHGVLLDAAHGRWEDALREVQGLREAALSSLSLIHI